MVQMRLADGNRSWKGGLVSTSDSDLGTVLGVRERSNRRWEVVPEN